MNYRVMGTLDYHWNVLPWRGESYLRLSNVGIKQTSNVCSLRMVM